MFSKSEFNIFRPVDSVLFERQQPVFALMGKVLLLVTFYCDGVMCARSANAINVAVACGYKKIYWLRDGFNEWKAQGFPYLSE